MESEKQKKVDREFLERNAKQMREELVAQQKRARECIMDEARVHGEAIGRTVRLTTPKPPLFGVPMIVLGVLLILITATHVGCLYLGWHMGRQQIQERVIVSPPDVEVTPEIKVTQGSSEVTIQPPNTLVTIPEPPPVEVHVLREDTKAELSKLHDLLIQGEKRSMETHDSTCDAFKQVYARLQRLAEEVKYNRAAVFSVGAPEIETQDPYGKLLPAPKNVKKGE